MEYRKENEWTRTNCREIVGELRLERPDGSKFVP